MTLQELKDKLSNSKLDESDQKVVEDFKHKRQELNKRISSWNYHIRELVFHSSCSLFTKLQEGERVRKA